jgi:hypothetical protein
MQEDRTAATAAQDRRLHRFQEDRVGMNPGRIYPELRSTRKNLALRAAAVLLGLAVLLVLAILPTEILIKGPTICVWKNLFGIDCPTCGMTRAFSSILHGKLAHALAYNKLVVLVFPMYCGLLLREAARLKQRMSNLLSSQ